MRVNDKGINTRINFKLQVQFTVPTSPQPLLGLQFLEYMTQTKICRVNILAAHRPEVEEIKEKLKNVIVSKQKK